MNRRLLAALLGLLSLFTVALATAVVVAFAWFDASLSDGVGDRSYAPATAADVHSAYKLGVGDLNLDLSNVDGATTKAVRAKGSASPAARAVGLAARR